MRQFAGRRFALGAFATGAFLLIGVASAIAQDSSTEPPAPTDEAPAVVEPPTPVLAKGVVAPGVRIARVPVGGLSRSQARAEIVKRHVAPRLRSVVVVYRGKRIVVRPASVGYRANVDRAVSDALAYGRSKVVPKGGVNVALPESVDEERIDAVLTSRVARFDVPARDASFSLRGVQPRVQQARPGIALNVPRSVRLVAKGLTVRNRSTFVLPSRRVQPAVRTLAPRIIIDRAHFRLTLWKHGQKSQTFPVAVGMPGHATPTGDFSVIEKQVNPTWFPPNSPWAAGLGPVPPGPGNPLGTRWIGTSAPAIGVHGTPDRGSIGTRASHGCIRMYIPDVERLYRQVEIGTRVYIR